MACCGGSGAFHQRHLCVCGSGWNAYMTTRDRKMAVVTVGMVGVAGVCLAGMTQGVDPASHSSKYLVRRLEARATGEIEHIAALLQMRCCRRRVARRRSGTGRLHIYISNRWVFKFYMHRDLAQRRALAFLHITFFCTFVALCTWYICEPGSLLIITKAQPKCEIAFAQGESAHKV